ncbi:ATP-binding protein [Georgenia sp. Z1491]|uniref:sensor histidine kinase n=1 Tax=Georgenia sp. Z1491 TaxID=3416707 RepID=UPI003CF4AD04
MSTRTRSVATEVLVVLSVVAAVMMGLSLASAYDYARRGVESTAATKVTTVAETIAATDDVVEGLASPDPAAALEEVVARELERTATDFIVVMDPDGTRHTHPTANLVGEEFIGNIDGARAGGIVLEQYTGTLGPSTRAVVPVLHDGEVIGLVAVGITRDRVADNLRDVLPRVLLTGLAAGTVAAGAALVVARRVRRGTLGLGAVELRRLHDHHEAVLHAVREGLIITDRDGRVQVANDEARRLLGLDEQAVGRPVDELDIPSDLAGMLTGADRHDEAQVHGGRILLVSSAEVTRDDDRIATLTTLRDRTELEELTGQLGTVQSLVDALQAQTHEASNRLHTVITLIELDRTDEALRLATEELRATQHQRDAINAAIEEPAVAALLLGKVAQAADRGVTLELDPDAHLAAGLLPPRQAVTVLGNLVDNAIDAAAALPPSAERRVAVDIQTSPREVLLTVGDTGPGLTGEAAEHAFDRGWSTKEGPHAARGIGLSLVQQTVGSLGARMVVHDPPGATFEISVPVPGRAPGQASRGADRG